MLFFASKFQLKPSICRGTRCAKQLLRIPRRIVCNRINYGVITSFLLRGLWLKNFIGVTSVFGKYKSIILSIALFIFLDASVLMLNFYISFEIAEDAVGVNLAGRQRMLSQRMVKSLLDFQVSDTVPREQKKALKELQLTKDLFDTTLVAFDEGGAAQSAGGGKVVLNRVESSEGRTAISDAKKLWEPYRLLIETLLAAESRPNESQALQETIAYAKQHNLVILKLMNDLTLDLENVARSKATRLRWIQTVGISLAIINFFIILFHFIGELRSGDRKLESARNETREILDTVNEGLFLVDKDLTIASQHSKKVSSMFGRSAISGHSFEVLLTDLVSDKDLETSKRFISLFFRRDIKSNLISDLNPLREIEVNIPDEGGGYKSKYLHFEFSRAYEGDEVKNILVTVNDITEKVHLERELKSAREQTEHQLEVLTGILHTNPTVLNRFVKDCKEGFQRINLFLREPAKNDVSLRKKLKDIFIEIHNFKGEAGALGLQSFQELAHKFESDIEVIKSKESIAGDDFFPLVVQLDKLMKHAESVEMLSEKLSEYTIEERPKAILFANDEWQHLRDLTETVANRTGKKVELVMSGLTEVPMGDELKKLVSEVSVQCIRNAIFHGIEAPSERVESYKAEEGRIDLRLVRRPGGQIELSIRDDGRGIDYDAIRTKAIETGQWTEQELESWDSKKLVSLIFEEGFSTAQDEQLDAGRGVGMDVIKKKIQEFRGKIRIASRRGTSTHFLISLPPLLGEEMAA